MRWSSRLNGFKIVWNVIPGLLEINCPLFAPYWRSVRTGKSGRYIPLPLESLMPAFWFTSIKDKHVIWAIIPANELHWWLTGPRKCKNLELFYVLVSKMKDFSPIQTIMWLLFERPKYHMLIAICMNTPLIYNKNLPFQNCCHETCNQVTIVSNIIDKCNTWWILDKHPVSNWHMEYYRATIFQRLADIPQEFPNRHKNSVGTSERTLTVIRW